MSVTFGVALPLEEPVPALVALAREVEALGYDTLWGNDERLQRDVYSVLAVIASHTSRLRLGPGVTNPYSRHPALTAVALGTLDEVAAGRAVLGMGAGGTNHRALGIARQQPARALREAIGLIRAMLRGEAVTIDGRLVRAREARLDFTPPRRDVPIHVGARGPLILRMAGELADGVIAGGIGTVEGWRYILAEVGRGAAAAKRPLADLRFAAWLYTAIADDPDAAVDAIRPMVATSLATSRPVLDQLGIEMPKDYARIMEGQGWDLSVASVHRAAPAVPSEIAARFGLAGTPDQCAERLDALLRAVPEIAQVNVVPFAPAGQTRLGVLRRFMEAVAPRLRSLTAGARDGAGTTHV
jgi:5,10-methylenetetrahydromethanopterin reductase